MRNIRQNLFFAFVYNSLGVPIAAGLLYPFFGLLLSPVLAAAAMSALDDEDQGIAAGVNNAMGQLAGLLAIIVLPALAGLAPRGAVAAAPLEFARRPCGPSPSRPRSAAGGPRAPPAVSTASAAWIPQAPGAAAPPGAAIAGAGTGTVATEAAAAGGVEGSSQRAGHLFCREQDPEPVAGAHELPTRPPSAPFGPCRNPAAGSGGVARCGSRRRHDWRLCRERGPALDSPPGGLPCRRSPGCRSP